MIKVKLLARTVFLTFAHPSIGAVEKSRSERSSVCRIFQLDDNTGGKTILAEGKTECSRQDNFNKAVGRKLALQRALCKHDSTSYFVNKILGIPRCETRCWKCGAEVTKPTALYHDFSKEERREIWRTYHRTIWGLEQSPLS